MFRKLVIAFITAVAALLETAADAIAATLPPPTVDSPRLRVVAPGRLCLRLLIVSPPACQSRPACLLGRTCLEKPVHGLCPGSQDRSQLAPVDNLGRPGARVAR